MTAIRNHRSRSPHKNGLRIKQTRGRLGKAARRQRRRLRHAGPDAASWARAQVRAAQLANQDQQPGRQPMTRAKTKAKAKANRPARCAGKCRKWLHAASGSTATILPKWPHSSLPPTSEHKCQPKPQQSRLAQIHRDKVKQSRLRPIAMAAFEVTTEALAGTGLTARYKSHHLAGGGSSLWSPLAVIRFYIRGENDRCHPLHSSPTGGSFPAPLFTVSRTANCTKCQFSRQGCEREQNGRFS